MRCHHHTCLVAVLVCSLVATSIGEPLPDIEDHVIHDAWHRAKRSLEVELEGIDNSKPSERTGSAYGLRSPKTPREETLQVWRSAEVFTRAVDSVCETHNVTRPVGERLVERAAPRSGLDPNILCRRRSFSCNERFKYRRIDGACNNIRNPDWGMAVSKLARLLDPVYSDGVNSFRQSVRGGELPLARVVSTTVIPDISTPTQQASHMIMLWGQFLNHDLTSTPHRTDLDKCCGEHGNNADCMPIRIPTNDDQFGPLRIGCMEFARSHRACGNGARQQMNQNTAFIDGSQIYGSVDTETRNVRDGGFLLSTRGRFGMLPPVNTSDQTCIKPPNNPTINCFIAGDNRANENPGLSAMHVLFLREHNRIADILSQRYRDPETLFQETRRIVIAELQNIFYSEFIPTILSRSTINEFALGLPNPGMFTDYDPSINPTTLNSFSTAGYRFGHSTIQGTMNMKGNRAIYLPEHFNNPSTIHAVGIEPILEGAAGQQSQRMDNFVTEAVTRNLFRENNNRFGMDLAALNIQRGRDHGLPSWNAFRRKCSLPAATSEADLRNFFIDSNAVRPFMEVYNGRIDDFDLWPAAIAEKPKDDGMLGPTFSCILAVQFNRLKWGDRFFFTHRNQAGSFTSNQLSQLRGRTLASIMCDNSFLRDGIQPNVFKPPGSGNAVTNCDNLPKLNLNDF